MTEIPTLPRPVVASPTALATDDRIEYLPTEIRLTFSRIRTLSEEFMYQSEEMLEELDKPPPRLIAKQVLLSAAWASIMALVEIGDGQTARLEELIAQLCRGELPRPQPPRVRPPMATAHGEHRSAHPVRGGEPGAAGVLAGRLNSAPNLAPEKPLQFKRLYGHKSLSPGQRHPDLPRHPQAHRAGTRTSRQGPFGPPVWWWCRADGPGAVRRAATARACSPSHAYPGASLRRARGARPLSAHARQTLDVRHRSRPLIFAREQEMRPSER